MSGVGCREPRPRAVRGGVPRQRNRRRGAAEADGRRSQGSRRRRRRPSAQDHVRDRGAERPVRRAGRSCACARDADPVPADAAERRQLTVMFCDLVGSTALSARLDPEDMRQVIRAYQDACSGVVARYDGFVAKFMGDGVLAYFGFPRAHEDDAARAVHAGSGNRRGRRGACKPARAKNSPCGSGSRPASSSSAISWGRAPAQEQAVVGDTPNLAARLQGLAEAGGVVVSAATRRLIGDRFRLKDLGRHAVKGLAEPVEAYAALGVSQSESRFEAAHAARLDRLRRARGRERRTCSRASAAPGAAQGQIVLISGDAGIGKSRLVRLARGAGRGDAAHAASLPMLALSSRQRALSFRAAIRARGGHRAAGAAPRPSSTSWRRCSASRPTA